MKGACLSALLLLSLVPGAAAVGGFTGIVTQEDGVTPISGITVKFIRPSDDFVMTAETTDVNGSYIISTLADGTYHVQIEQAGYFPVIRSSYTVAGGLELLNFALQSTGTEPFRDTFSTTAGWSTSPFAPTGLTSNGNVMKFRSVLSGGAYQGTLKNFGVTYDKLTYPYVTIRNRVDLNSGKLQDVDLTFDYSAGWNQRIFFASGFSSLPWVDRTYAVPYSWESAFLINDADAVPGTADVDHYLDYMIIHTVDRGYVSGQVLSPSAAPFPGTRVELRKNGVAVGEGLTDASGNYEIWAAVGGSYSVYASSTNGAVFEQSGLTLAGRVSTPVAVVLDTVTITDPEGVRFIAVSSVSASVYWDNNTHDYWVAFSTAPDFSVWLSSGLLPLAQNVTHYYELGSNTTHYFKIKTAVKDDTHYTAVISSATDPAVPLSPSVQAVYPSSAAVSWSHNGNSDGTIYFLEAARDSGYTLDMVVATATWPGPGLSFELPDLGPDSTYYMRIRALGFGPTDSAFASIGTTVTLAVAPASPFYDAVYSTRAVLSWSPEENPYWTIYETRVSTDDFATLNYSTRAAADYISVYPLTPNTTHYFRTAAVNGYGHYSEFMTFQSTLTLSAAPGAHGTPLTPLEDDYNSVTAQWAYNGNPNYTEYYVQASTDPAFNGIDAGSPREWATGLSVTVTPLDPSTEYFFRVRSRDLYGRTSAWLGLGSVATSAGADTAPPTIIDLQGGDDTWRGASGGNYQVYFTDLVSGLARFDVLATTGPDMGSQEIAPWTTAAVFAGEQEYNTAWPLPSTVFSAISEGVTAYISVRVHDMEGNVAYSTAPFYVRRDLTAPPAGSPSASPESWLNSDPGAVFSMPFSDALSGLVLVQYSASRSQGTGNGNVLGWTTIDSFVSSASWSETWGVDFAALQDAVTNYISVRAYDAAGNITQVTDAFRLLKNTIGPFAGVTWPAALFTSSAAAITGTAAPSDSVSQVAAVEVALRQESSGLYWDGDAAFTSAAHAWLTPSGLESWSLDVSTLPLVNLSSYTAVVRAADDLARYSAGYSSFTFTLDTGEPSVYVSTPAVDSQVYDFDEVSGTAADGAGEAGLARVEVAVRRVVDGRWWNPFSRAWGTTLVSSAAAGGSAWSFYPDARLRGELLHELTYYVTAAAYDAAYPANTSGFMVQGTTFTYHDTVPPGTPYSVAGTSGTLPGRMRISWVFAGDDGNAGYLPQGGFAVHYATWTGFSPSTSAAQVQISTAALEAGTTINYLVADLWSNTTYYFRVWARDDAGLWSSASAEGEGVSGEDLDRRIAGHVRLPSGAGVTGVLMEASLRTSCTSSSGMLLSRIMVAEIFFTMLSEREMLVSPGRERSGIPGSMSRAPFFFSSSISAEIITIMSSEPRASERTSLSFFSRELSRASLASSEELACWAAAGWRRNMADIITAGRMLNLILAKAPYVL
ncbi:MAG: carboxypeptidase regulatory-like domain-containing protein [Elusimicrobiota bacterium]